MMAPGGSEVGGGEARQAGARVWISSGFTLIELLVVTMLMGIVITAIGACLGGGLRVWDAAQRFGTSEAEGLAALEFVCRDLRSTFALQDIPFQAQPGALVFPGLVRDVTPDSGVARLGAIRYDWDASRGALMRSTAIYEGVRLDGTTSGAWGRRESVAVNVVGFEVSPEVSPLPPGAVGTNSIPSRMTISVLIQASEDDPVVALTREIELVAGGGP